MDLPFVYSTFANYPGSFNNVLNNSTTSNGFWMTVLASAVLSVLHFTSMFLFWSYSIYANYRATAVTTQSIAEGTTHGLIWLGLVFYIIWTLASIRLAVDQTIATDSAAYLLGQWSNGLLHAAVVFAFTAAAVASLGASQAFRTGSFFLNTGLFFILFPISVYVARTNWDKNVSGQCNAGNGNGYLCDAEEAVAAGMLGVASVAFLLHLASIPLAFVQTAPEYAQGVKTSTTDPASPGNNYQTGSNYNNQAGTGYQAAAPVDSTPGAGIAPNPNFQA